MSDCCGCHFCKSCIEKWLETNLSHTCPFCRSPSFNHIQDKPLERKIRELKVECVKTKSGCHWVGTLFDIQAHLDSCIHVLVKCANGCGATIPRGEVSSHESELCSQRLMSCLYCSQKFVYKFLLEEHPLTCSEMPMLCGNCKERVKRGEMQSHLEQACPSLARVSCSASTLEIHDKVDRPVPNSEQNHLLIAIQNLIMEVSALKNETQTLKTERDQMREEVRNITKEMQVNRGDLEFIRAENLAVRRTLLNELEFICDCSQNPARLAVECIRTQLKETENSIFLQQDGRTVTFRLLAYNEHKATGKVWFSPPFYVSTGYKLRLAIHPNGIGVGKGTHVSLCLHQKKGAYDEKIKWPYHWLGSLELRLMDQCPSEKGRNKGSYSPSIPTRGFSSSPKVKTLPSKLRSRGRDLDIPLETQEMQVEACLSKVTDWAEIGPVITMLELFCTQHAMDAAEYENSVVLQCCVKSSGSPSPYLSRAGMEQGATLQTS